MTLHAQRLSALDEANRRRRDRKELREAVAAGEAQVTDLVADPPTCVRSLLVGELLQWQRSWGPYRSRRFLRTFGIEPSTPLASLRDAQRRTIIYQLGRDR